MMKRSPFVWLSSFVLLLCASLPVFAQGAQSLQGKVIAPNGSAPVQPVKVTLTLSGRRIYETFTDLGGNFSFSSLRNGTYELTAEGDGVTFETTSVSAEVTAFGGAPQSFTQNIQLRPKQVNATTPPGVVSAFNQDVPKAARETFERAKKMAHQGKAELALSLMREAIKLFSEYFEAHLELGNELLQTGKLDEAIAELDQARKINPNDDRTYQSFGLVLMKQQKYSIAVGIFAEASRLNPTNPMNPLMRGIALIHQASTIEPTQSATARSDREYLLARAELALTQASDLSGKKLTADHLSLAMLYEMKGEPARAAEELEQYLRKNPNIKNADAVQAAIKKLRTVK
jgi:tetratricopeptide (TPR) repeat protein